MKLLSFPILHLFFFSLPKCAVWDAPVQWIELACSWSKRESLKHLTIKYDVCWRCSVDTVISSLLFWVWVYDVEFYQNAFSALRCSYNCFPCVINVNYIEYNFQKLNQIWISDSKFHPFWIAKFDSLIFLLGFLSFCVHEWK